MMNYKLNKTMTKGEIDKALLNDKLNKTMQRMDKAYTLLGKIPVTGDSVDVMALVRMEMREGYADMVTLKAELEKRPAGEEKDNGSPDRG